VIGWLVANWPLKLASVAAGMALWAFVATTERARVVLSVPVEYVGLGKDRLLVGDRPDTVDVEVEAVRWVAARVSSGAVRARVNVAGLPDGESVVSVSPGDIDVPPGASITRISPGRVRVTLAGTARQTVRVTPDIRGRPAPGFVVGRVVVDPPAVQIEGPRATIEGRDAVTTAAVDVTDARQSITEQVALSLPVSVSSAGERAVRVTVEIRAEDTMQHRESSR
jgi:YbbR domain-containing protein